MDAGAGKRAAEGPDAMFGPGRLDGRLGRPSRARWPRAGVASPRRPGSLTGPHPAAPPVRPAPGYPLFTGFYLHVQIAGLA